MRPLNAKGKYFFFYKKHFSTLQINANSERFSPRLPRCIPLANLTWPSRSLCLGEIYGLRNRRRRRRRWRGRGESARDGGADEGAARTTAAAGRGWAGDKSGRKITGRVEHRCQAVKFLSRNLMKLDYRQRAADDLTYGPNNSRRANGPKLIVGRSIDNIVSPRVFDDPVSA